MVNRGNPKRCPKCDRKLLKLKTEKYEALADEHTQYVFGRICLTCNVCYQNKEFENFKIVVDDVGSP